MHFFQSQESHSTGYSIQWANAIGDVRPFTSTAFYNHLTSIFATAWCTVIHRQALSQGDRPRSRLQLRLQGRAVDSIRGTAVGLTSILNRRQYFLVTSSNYLRDRSTTCLSEITAWTTGLKRTFLELNIEVVCRNTPRDPNALGWQLWERSERWSRLGSDW